MNIILSNLFAYLSLFMIIILFALFPLSKMIENNKFSQTAIKLKCTLKKYHKLLGIMIIFIMFIHGKTTGVRPGIEAILILVLSILLACSYLLKNKFPNAWIKLHRILSFILVIAVIIHIVIALI